MTASPADVAPVLDPALLAELRAALAAGAPPSAALAAAVPDRPEAPSGDGVGSPLAVAARAVRLGRPLEDVAATVATGVPSADLLVRALAIAERSGGAASVAVEQAARAAADEAALDRVLRVRTAQARGTAVVLAALPLAGWVLLVGLDRAVLAFYTTAVGAVTGSAAVALAALGQWWSRRIVAAARRAGHAADPLVAGVARPAVVPLAVLGVAVLLGGSLLGGLVVGVPAAALGVGVAWRRATGAADAEDHRAADHGRHAPSPDEPPSGGAAEAVELVGVALAAGLPAAAAVELVARLGPPAARSTLASAARRMAGSWTADAAFAGGGLERLGAVLGAAQRWGAPAGGELRRLAAALRDERRAAVEEAAERTQLALVFPTTLLTLPAFVLGVVPPLLWTAFAT